MSSVVAETIEVPNDLDPVDIVVALSYESIGDIIRRGFARPPDRFIAGLMDHPQVNKLMIVSPWRSGPISIVKRLLGKVDPELPSGHGAVLVNPRRLRRSDPSSIRALERGYRSYDKRIEAAVQKAGLVDPLLIVFHPIAAGFMPARWSRSVTYYARDDWSELPSYARWHEAFRESYRRIRAQKRRVVAVSNVLLDRLDPDAPAAAVPNGIDQQEWTEPAAAPDWFRDLPQPRFVYVGTLDERLDLNGVRTLAAAYPEGSIVLAGPMPPNSPVATLSLDNVHLPGSQDRDTVVGMVHESDACLMTHERNELTKAMSPLKIYEYLAGGRPVIATRPSAGPRASRTGCVL